MPFLFRSTEHLHAVLDGPIGEEILTSFEAQGFIGLTYYDSGARSIYTRGRAVRTIEDLKGLRIRVQPSAPMIELMKALGAVPVALRYGTVETALSTGLIDGAENNWPAYVTTNHYKVARNYTVTEHTMTPEVLVMSKRAWESLSEEDRLVFREAARESKKFMRLHWTELEEQSRQRVVAAGNVIITEFPRRPLEEAMESVYAKAMSYPAIAR